jgi:predicted  nucleic acid-binding Zn-ribbon protein
MATALEAIAERLEAARKEKLESILSVSGSQSIAKNDYNVTIVDEQIPASSLLFKSLSKDRYDDVELVKAIDIEVKELRPNIPTPNLNLVPKPLYDEVVVDNDDLRKQVSDLTTEVQTLTETVSDLNSQVQTEINTRLNIEQTNDVLLNQLDILTGTIQDFTTQIQSAVQKSIDESILRASLQSQNAGFKAQIEALIKQIDSLNSIIEGLQAQLGAVQQQTAITSGTLAQAQAAGADVVNEVAIVKFEPNEDASQPKIWAKFKAGGGSKWVNGSSLEITNNDKTPITIKLTKTNPESGKDFYTIPQMEFTMAAGENKKLDLTLNEANVGGLDSRRKGGIFGGTSKSKDYKGGSLKVTVTRSDGSSKDKTYESGFGKKHPDSF